ncbi:MAG: response regulator [Chloroflexi bacterium]|nr:response regulator [Chloroflexota bacterium]
MTKRPDDTTGETEEAPRERLSLLSEASLRINESLDFDTVLQGVLDSARSLTAARYGVMTLLGDEGGVQDFLSSGLTAAEAERLWHIPDGPHIFELLSDISEPLRLPDLVEYVQALGFPEFHIPLPVGSLRFLAAPMFHGGARVGHVFVGGNDDGAEFSRADEETLVMFASQAALVIANARTHREERQARADLETLVNTSPVGVVVFDAQMGVPLSVNREARRIVDGLREGEQTTEDLLKVVTYVRADGREISLGELPLAEALRNGETIRAEEITLRVPDGRRVSVLLNATPIHGEDGQLASFVVMLQDMTPLEEQERLRAEFLAMVSHELRAPLTSIKGSAATVLGSVTEMDPAVVRQFFRLIEEQADRMHDLVADLLDVARIETGTLPVSPEPAEVAVLVDKAKNAFASAGSKNRLAIDIGPDLPLVLADRRRIVQVLSNLLANAARHSPDSSVIRVGAVRDGVHVAISVADAGRGIPAESLPLLFRKFSVAQPEDQGGDTGLGLAICKGIVEAHGGRIWAESEGAGLGARFTFTLPTADGAGSDGAGGVASPSSRPSQRSVRTAEEPVRVLAVDDNPEDLRYVRDALAQSGYKPIVTGDPDEALSLMEDERPGLVLLDLMLPGTDGIELMKEILKTADVPVIFLSVYGQEDLIAKAFETGAADYMVKPFSPTELAARIKAALRKREPSEPSEPYVRGELIIDYAERRVTLAGRLVELMALEYRVLVELSANAGRIVTQEQLLQRVWGERSGGDTRPMRTVVSRLRRKLGDDAKNPTYLFTEPRVGYRMPKGEPAEPEDT